MTNTRKTEEDYQAEGARIGLVWIGPVLPRNRLEKTVWQCEEYGERLAATLAKVKVWKQCPVCRTRKPKTEADYRQLSQEHGIAWLGSRVPRNVLAPTLWRCPQGHEFTRPYAEIHRGRGCRVCGRKRARIREIENADHPQE